MRYKKTSLKNRSSYKWYEKIKIGGKTKICVRAEFTPQNDFETQIIEELHRMDDRWVESNLRNHCLWSNATKKSQNEEWLHRRMAQYERDYGRTMDREDAMAELQIVAPKWLLSIDDAKVNGVGASVFGVTQNGNLPSDIQIKMEEVVGNLSYIDQKIYRLFVDGYTQKEISEKINITERAVRTHISKIKIALKNDKDLKKMYLSHIRSPKNE